MVQALVAGLIAVIAALVLASRLLASRFGSFSRSETLTAREAAEYGLNEMQALLNSDQYNHLWVTKFNNWGTVTRQQLSDCGLNALNSSGTIIDPALPSGVTSAKQIKSDNNGTISYQVTAFQPPDLPDSNSQTTLQSQYCDSSTTSATNFGNLEGGSALITVTATVTRGNGQSAKSTSIALTRRTHVASPGAQLAFSFMILGDAYKRNSPLSTYGASTDIAALNYDQGNICYAQPSTNLSRDNCFSPKTLPKTVIGCYDLGSCLINNVDNLSTKQRSTWCANVSAKKKRRKGYTCNDFQQASTLPNPPTPATEGFINASGDTYSSSDWSRYSSPLSCNIGDGKCDDPSDKSKAYDSSFPYRGKTPPTSLSSSSRLVDGCYYNNVTPERDDDTGAYETTYNSNATEINCLTSTLSISGNSSAKPNLIIYTSSSTDPKKAVPLLPVNIFLYGSTNISLAGGGIDNSDRSTTGWTRLRVYGKTAPPRSDGSVNCAGSASITSTRGNDLNNMFLWLPNASLSYSRQASRDTSYMVIWVCKFAGPTRDSRSNLYSIITPLPEQLVRAGLVTNLGASFSKSAGSTYRGFGSEDTSN